jgi:hypothetical protein
MVVMIVCIGYILFTSYIPFGTRALFLTLCVGTLVALLWQTGRIRIRRPRPTRFNMKSQHLNKSKLLTILRYIALGLIIVPVMHLIYVFFVANGSLTGGFVSPVLLVYAGPMVILGALMLAVLATLNARGKAIAIVRYIGLGLIFASALYLIYIVSVLGDFAMGGLVVLVSVVYASPVVVLGAIMVAVSAVLKARQSRGGKKQAVSDEKQGIDVAQLGVVVRFILVGFAVVVVGYFAIFWIQWIIVAFS